MVRAALSFSAFSPSMPEARRAQDRWLCAYLSSSFETALSADEVITDEVYHCLKPDCCRYLPVKICSLEASSQSTR